MQVTLINYTNEKLADVAAAICVNKFEQQIRNKDLSSLEAALKSNHLSVTEHLPLTWVIKDISRSCLQQLVRHRLASYSVLSQRYNKIELTKEQYCLPQSILSNSHLLRRYKTHMQNTYEFYTYLCDHGITKEDARMILPEATYTSLVMTMNARSFIEAASKRRCKRAQWEIRELFNKLHNSIIHIYPYIAKLAVPNCQTKIGCLENKPCKKIVPIQNIDKRVKEVAEELEVMRTIYSDVSELELYKKVGTYFNISPVTVKRYRNKYRQLVRERKQCTTTE